LRQTQQYCNTARQYKNSQEKIYLM